MKLLLFLLLLVPLAACGGGSTQNSAVTGQPATTTRALEANLTPATTVSPPTPAELPSATVAPPTASATSISETPRPETATTTPPAAGATTPSAGPATTSPASTQTTAARSPAFSYPIGRPGRPLGDRFFIRHGYMVENTWYNPGYWHTGEDWYATEGDTAGAGVFAVGDGEVVYVGANYPGRVVIVRHADDLFSMYGHLDPNVLVAIGQSVLRGDQLGTVLERGDETPNHLHFEIRTFLTTDVVNGAAPRYPFRCGVECPPGPGYWPFDAPHAGELGWRNPTHVLAHHATVTEDAPGEVVTASSPVSPTVSVWSAPLEAGVEAQLVGDLSVQPGQRYPLLDVRAGPEDVRATGAESYQLWYRIELGDGERGWVQAAVPSTFETGADGRAATVRFNFYPASTVAP